jgi:hypothetical protein
MRSYDSEEEGRMVHGRGIAIAQVVSFVGGLMDNLYSWRKGVVGCRSP